MSTPMDDEPLSPELREAAKAYHRPPETPREAIWEMIQAGRLADSARVPGEGASERRVSASPTISRSDIRANTAAPRRSPLRRASAAWLGVAAALAIAFGLGRLSSRPETRWNAGVPVGAAPAPVGVVAFRVAAVEHLGQAESFLTLFRASVRSGTHEGLASPTARQLLATNRLMLDSPASADPKLRLLLEDLELVLAGIAQISPARASEELDLITDGLERSAVLLRLRAAVPAGGTAPARPGAL